MAGTALRGRLTWQVATVDSVTTRRTSVRTIELDVPDWPGHRAGQHLDVRLTAEDGYAAERSYSIASAPGEPVAITVERLEDGEVSPYLTDELRAGDELELRGPIGGYFVWEPERRRPAAAAGRRVGDRAAAVHPAAPPAHRQHGPGPPAVLLPQLDDVIYRAELDQPAPGVAGHPHADPPPAAGLAGYARRVDEPCWPRSRGRPPQIRWPTSAGRRASSRRWPGWCSPATRRSRSRPSGSARREEPDGAVDGNAIGGLLHRGLRHRDDRRRQHLRNLRRGRPVAELVVYLRAPGTVVRCRTCYGHPHGHLADPGHELYRPRRPDCARPPPGRLTSAGSALLRSGRPIRRGPDASATRTPGIHAGPGTRRR